jgi:hypothetical protein
LPCEFRLFVINKRLVERGVGAELVKVYLAVVTVSGGKLSEHNFVVTSLV